MRKIYVTLYNFRYVIIIFIFGFILLRIVMSALSDYHKDNQNVAYIEEKSIYEDDSYSVITENRNNSNINKVNVNIIDNFIEYCNNGNVKEAYDLLSSDCKESKYPNVDIFTNNYYNKIFETSKTYTVQAWISDTR